jgi:arylsulfatase A-like enzyme
MKKPNIIIIMTDDQGYGDLSCMGATDFKTPNIDRLCKNGVRFTSWYAGSPVCSPSRVTMIGSTETGLSVIRDSTTSIKHFSLELGGNAPVAVMEDADVK